RERLKRYGTSWLHRLKIRFERAKELQGFNWRHLLDFCQLLWMFTEERLDLLAFWGCEHAVVLIHHVGRHSGQHVPTAVAITAETLTERRIADFFDLFAM